MFRVCCQQVEQLYDRHIDITSDKLCDTANASILCLSDAAVRPYHAGTAWRILAITIAL